MKLKILAIATMLSMTCSTLITTASIDDSRIGSLDDSSCYGFIVPIVKLENKTLENDIDCRIHHMINDFLREKISVFWTAENCTTSILKMNNSEEKDMFFEKGTFIIHFTENNTINTKIIAIICDYNQTSEIEQDAVCIPVYELIEPLEIKAHELSELKIARYVGSATHDTQYYLFIATQCGFLDFDIIYTKEIEEKLTLDNYNVIIWPGGETWKWPFYQRKSSIEEIKYNAMDTIRKFVENGGGYVGSCYGAGKSSILWFIPRVGLYLPNLGISGTIAIDPKLKFKDAVICKQKIMANNNPVTYGLDQIVTDYYGGGPSLICVGKNSQVLALYQECNDYLDNTPSWVSNTYGEGKVIIFSSHPEIIGSIQEDFNGKHVVSNTWYHLTNKGIIDIGCEHSVNLSIIDGVIENTSNLINSSSIPQILFNDVLNNINDNISKMQEIKTIVEEIRNNKSSIDVISETIRKLSGNINRSIECFEKISIILNSIEKIYPLLVSKVNFSGTVQLLLDDLFLRLNNIESLIIKSKENTEDAKYELDKYQNNIFLRSKIKEFYIKDLLFTSLRNISEAHAEISQTYHESLKFLRHNWYDYETNLALSGL